ncbi:MAG: coiled-coil domain-containing protein [Candidatus Krumholzibacteriia bacterium]
MVDTESRARFDRELGRLLGAARRRVLWHGVLSLAGAGGLLGGVAAWALGGEIAPSAAARAGLLVCTLALVIAVAVARLLRPLRRLRDRGALCRELEREGGLDNLLVAAAEAVRRPERWGAAAGVSAALVDRLYAAALGRAREIRLGRRLPLPGAWVTIGGVALAAGLLLGGGATAPGRFAVGAGRLLLPLRDDRLPPGAGLYLAEGPREAVAGADFTVAARDLGRGRGPVTCEVRVGSGLWRAVPCAPARGAGDRLGTVWSATLPDVRESFAYRFGRDGVTTPAAAVTVIHPPLLTVWGGTLRPPAYTRLPAQTMARFPGRLQAPAGSRLTWLGAVAGEVARAAVVTAAGDTLPLAVRGDTLRGAAEVQATLAYTVALRDRRGLGNSPRVSYAVEAIPDAPPVATLTRPADDGHLPGDGRVALVAGAGDDYGVTGIELLLRRERGGGEAAPADDRDWSRVTVWPLPGVGGGAVGLATPWGAAAATPGAVAGPAPAGPFELPLALEAAGLELLSGDVLALCVEVVDNRVPGPPGRTRSPVLRLALPSATEVLAEEVGGGRERVEALEGLRRKGEELTQELAKIDRDLRQDTRAGWEQRQQVQAALERQRALQDEFRNTAQALQQDLARLEQNNLNSVELLDKMQEVAALIEQVHSEELDRLLAQLRDQAAALPPEQVRQAMEQIARNQEEYKERLDRAIGLLKEMAREQEMEGLTAVVERLLREQQALLDAAAADSTGGAQPQPQPSPSTPSPPAPSPAGPRQAALADEARRLEQQLREALDRLDKAGDRDPGPTAEAMRQALREALEQLQAQRPDQDMQEASRRLSTSPPSASPQEPQQQALRELAALYHVLLRGQMQMQGAMQQYASANLRRLAADLLALSEREETIAGAVPTDLRGVALGDLARRQNRVLRATRGVRDRMQEVGSRSPVLSMRMIRDLDEVVAGLGNAVQGLEQGTGAVARRESRDSIGKLNRIVIGLLTAAQQEGQGGGGGEAMPAPSRQLQQMAQEQAGLNAFAQELQRRLQQQGPSQEARAGMQRLQAEQGGLAGRLEELARGERADPPGERVLGDLDQLARDMERVADDLGAGRIDDETLARQERILGRLLDAHNSVRKRDFSQRRESRAAQAPFARQAGEAGAPVADDPAMPFARRQEAVAKAPADYRDLVRRYYRALDQLLSPPAAVPEPPAPAPPPGGAR